ncbi:MAG: hypothetical protein JXQ91_04625 [Vannielia sp.]|uniref:hypothetical protein n=1 Tax=Vannielia sp. TaxID=2813045 RepID=UPI003B8D7D53
MMIRATIALVLLCAPLCAQGIKEPGTYEKIVGRYDGCIRSGAEGCVEAALESCGQAGDYEGCMRFLAQSFQARISLAVTQRCMTDLAAEACTARAYGEALDGARGE